MWVLPIRKGRVWKVPPTKVAMPVSAPRTTELPRPLSSPSSESPSDRPMLIAAPSEVASPTRKAACAPARKAVAKIGARVDTVPSISPISEGCTTRRIWACRPWPRHHCSSSLAVREMSGRPLRVGWAAVDSRGSGRVSVAVVMAAASRRVGPTASTTWLTSVAGYRLISRLRVRLEHGKLSLDRPGGHRVHQPTHPVDRLRGPAGRAGRGHRPAGPGPVADPDRTGWGRQDPTGAAGGRRGGRGLPGRGVVCGLLAAVRRPVRLGSGGLGPGRQGAGPGQHAGRGGGPVPGRLAGAARAGQLRARGGGRGRGGRRAAGRARGEGGGHQPGAARGGWRDDLGGAAAERGG